MILPVHHHHHHPHPHQLKELGRQQADWESQRMDLEQRVEDGEDKGQKLEKYGPPVPVGCPTVTRRLSHRARPVPSAPALWYGM